MRLSIVTPSYNQARFLQDCIDSVLSQHYPDMEYLVMDGGSKDLSVEILKTYGDKIQWVSEPDGGQAAGVNKGILRATGDIIGWLNSDDMYYPGSFQAVMEVFEKHPDVDVVYGYADHVKEDGSYLEDYYTEEWNYERLKEICFLCQPAVFFRKKAVMEVGLLNPDRHFAMDYDLWLRLGKNKDFYFLHKKLAKSRLYAENKTLGFVDKVHIDIMDTLLEDTGSISERWLIGSANSVARTKGYDLSTEAGFHDYINTSIQLIGQYNKRYHLNPDKALDKFPYSFHDLRIGLDVSLAFQKNGAGVGQMSGIITRGIMEAFPKQSYVLLTGIEKVFDPEVFVSREYRQCTNVLYAYENPALSISQVNDVYARGTSEQVLQMCRYPNVVLYPSFTFSPKLSQHTKSVYILYDLSFLEHHEYTTDSNYFNCYQNVFYASLYADIILAISEYSKQVFLRYFPYVRPEKIRVIRCGYRKVFSQPDKETALSEIGLKSSDKFWLSVGTVEPRKNMVSLIEAYSMVSKDHETAPLLIAGGKGWLNHEIYDKVKQLGLENKVRFLGYVTDDQMNALYHRCIAMVYPSFYEGFGLPILEAMAAGAPVICSNTTSMPEVGGDAVQYIDPYSVNSIAEAMKKVEKDKKLRGKMSTAGKKRVRDFEWSQCVRDVYEAVMDAAMSEDD